MWTEEREERERKRERETLDFLVVVTLAVVAGEKCPSERSEREAKILGWAFSVGTFFLLARFARSDFLVAAVVGPSERGEFPMASR
jgi:hypothetical protein